ncbi:MAG: hypothetical protein C5B49_11240 [Bdellovibrio sp.]|nr:MAG: hypothetical protein C5B49_11240 [Bdellovibrio sp.]
MLFQLIFIVTLMAGSPTSGSWDGTPIPNRLPGNLTAAQADTILRLVSIAENGTTEWWKKYSYIEDIGDGRGFTLNIVGFCTGTGDFLWLVKDLERFAPHHPLVSFERALEKVNGSDSHAGLTGLPRLVSTLNRDADYLHATWDAIVHFYWGPAMRMAESLDLKTVLSKGQLYDILLNMGDFSLLEQVKAKPPSKGGDEMTWLAELQARWLHHITKVDLSLDSGQPDRALLWRSLRKSGNKKLQRPLKNLRCYGQTFSID